MIDMVLETDGMRDGDFANIQSIAYGAAPMSPALLTDVDGSVRLRLHELFGAGTEAGLQTVLAPEDHRRALRGASTCCGSIGSPAYGVVLRLCDDDCTTCPPARSARSSRARTR